MDAKISRIGAMLIGVVVCAGLVLIEIYPHRPRDAVGWGVLLMSSVPLVLGLEFIGTRTLENSSVARMRRSLRIAYGVLVMIAILASVLGVWRWVAPNMGTW
jgi:hypothetical protein